MKTTLVLPFLRLHRPVSFRTRRWIAFGRRLFREVEAAIGQTSLVLFVLAILAIILFAVAEHQNQKALVLRAETERFVEEFRSEPVASSWRRLSEVWRQELPRQQTLLERANRSDGDPGQALERWRAFLLETIAEARLQRDIEVVLAYFRRLALCVRMGNCDTEQVAARIGDLPRRFRNQHHPYLVEAHPGEDLDRYFELIAPPEQRLRMADRG